MHCLLSRMLGFACGAVLAANAFGQAAPTDLARSYPTRPVKVIGNQGSDWIIESGLQPGEQVVVDGFQKMMMARGAPVTTVPWTPAAASGAAASGAASAAAAASAPASAARPAVLCHTLAANVLAEA